MVIDHFQEHFIFIKGNHDQYVGWCYFPEKTLVRVQSTLKDIVSPQNQIRAMQYLGWEIFTYADLLQKAYEENYYLCIGADMKGYFYHNMARLHGDKHPIELHKGNAPNTSIGNKVKRMMRMYLDYKIEQVLEKQKLRSRYNR